MDTEYRDRWITCTSDALVIRGYYFPWGSKRIPYASIRSVQLVNLKLFSGRLRGWGTSNPRYWASLDPGRPGKQTALVLDVGRLVHPFITPDDADSVTACIRAHCAAPVSEATGPLLI